MASRFLAPLSGGLGTRGRDPLLGLQQEVNRLFEDVFSGAGSLMGIGGGSQPGSLLSMPRLDVRENDKELCITAELPGVKESDIDLRIEGDLLTLSGEKKNEFDEKRENYHMMERSYGQFRRTVQLPFSPDPAQVQADFEQGVLTIRMPMQAQQQRSRRVEIRHGGAPQERQLGAPGSTQAPGTDLPAGASAPGGGTPSGSSTHH